MQNSNEEGDSSSRNSEIRKISKFSSSSSYLSDEAGVREGRSDVLRAVKLPISVDFCKTKHKN